MAAGSARPTDAALVRRIAGGDEDALAELYDRHADAVFRLAFRLTGDRQIAEEVLQESYLALWNRAELYDERVGSLPAWLMSIARNRAVDRLRAAGRRLPAVPMSAAANREGASFEATLASGALLGAAAPATDPQESIDAAWLRDAVRSALDGVPDVERKAIQLAYYEDLTQSEIAERLGWPLGTVKTRTRRALARLRSTLAEALGPELGALVEPVPVVEAPRSHVQANDEQAREMQGTRDGSR